MMWQNLVVVFVAGFVSLVRASNYSYVVNTFDAEDTAFFSHMVRDAATGNVYVAGVNTIYELSDSLLMVRRKIIGPKEDSPSCFVQTLSTCPSKRLTDVHAKTVVMDKRNGRLIVCISIYQGACRKYMLSNIEIEDVIQGEGRNKPVVPNDEVASTFGLLAPGKVPSHDVFYIAAQRGVHYASTSQGNVFAISSRHPNNFALIKDDIEGKSRVQLDGILDFSIEYVTAFSYSGFTYFLVVQKSSTQDNNIISKLARVCQKDEKYTSYAEVPLECIAGGTKYNKAQAAYLTRPGKKLFDSLKMNTATNTESLFVLFSIDDSNRSAMCVYTMWDIITKFTENIQQCFNGNGMTGPDHFTNPVQCQKLDSTLFPINDQYCGEHGAGNEPIGTNRLPITHEPVITWDDKVTAIAVTATNDYTVAFVGTENGMLKKVVVETEISATEYKEIPIAPGQKILNNLMFGSQEKYLYVMTSRKLTRIKVEECQKYSGCNQCIINDNDPYCGWCTLESKCTTHNKCANSDKPMHWLPYNNMKCTEITSVSPSMTQIENDQQNLNIYIQNLPTVTGATYKCAFYMNEGSDPLLTIGSKTDRGITCLTPPRQDLPNIPTGTDHITMLLAVRSNGQDFVATNFSFFNCALHASCSTCTRSAFPCTFCVRQHKCTHNGEVCGSDVLVTGVNVPGISERSGPDHCPRIKSNDNKITVASGYAKTVSVEAYNLQSIEVPFKCKFTMSNGNVITKNALKRDSRIECDRMVFSYPATSPTQLIPFQITWGSSEYPLDNPENIQVQIYKCKQLAAAGGVANCGSCLTLSSNYQCGWCQQLSSCLVQQECTASNWLMPRDDCPNPQITSISPSTGPLSGGTLVTINGINLGKDFSDVLNGVSVANVPCIAKQDLYVKTSKIVCVTGASSSARSGTVSATIAGKFSVQSSDKFKYVNPTITHFQPKLGIQAGGARVTFYGKHLNAGTRVIAMLGLNPCRVESKSENEAVCRTSAVTNPTDVTVEMRFDNQTVRASSRFKFVGNPNITDFGRGKGFKIGGLAETITGTNFDAVQEPKMFIDYKGMRYYGACQIVSPTALRCVSPSLEKKVNKRAVGNTEGAVFGFGLDDYEILVNGVFHLYPDPVFNKFENDELIISKKIDSLKIQGSNLSPTLTKNDLSVHIGSGDCDVTLLIPAEEQDDSNFDEIHCKLPPIEDGVNSYQVQVLIGGNTNRTFVIGSLVYEDEEALPLWAYIVLGAGGLIMLVIIIVVIVAYKRKSKQSDKQVQHMQHQMDVLETKVAKECKEAFAELQTDMTEMTSDLTGLIGMPFLDYRSFGMRVLFPNCNEYEHPVVRELEVDYIRQESLERGLRQFGQLMNNKTFLLLFIRTLESNKQFSMRERVNVASLVSVALQGKMEYMTDILKTLLADLIEKSVEGKSHPKLLLRRTESVAEKMLTNWFTFLLFKFLKECAGEPLFMLFRAIKQQVEKGPIDAITGEAKYSLSEDKLIRQQMDYKVLTIYVIEAETYSNQQHPVKVLDVDTISQVKEKILDAIYKNAPFSSRHGREELDLEWHTGAQGRIILQDEDKITAKTEDGGFKRLNTLAHYGVTDNATMALVAKQQQYSNHSILSDKSARSRDYENMTSSPSMSRVLSPNSSSLDVEGGSKLYHLVKPQDSDLQREGERGSKMVSEIYLTRLLATKGTLQQFVDDLFETIFSTAHRGSALPLAIKYMFDFLDDQALLHGITDPETVHTWKSNSLPLRFWVNVIKNPNFVFDVYKSSIVDSCLSVVAQTFMDSCSMSDHRLGKDSPATKLLYAKDIPKYKKWVERYYQDIKLMPAISDQDMNALLAEESRMHQSEFNSVAALNELYQYAIKYNEQLHQILEEDEFARKNRLSHRLEQVHMCMETEV